MWMHWTLKENSLIFVHVSGGQGLSRSASQQHSIILVNFRKQEKPGLKVSFLVMEMVYFLFSSFIILKGMFYSFVFEISHPSEC